VPVLVDVTKQALFTAHMRVEAGDGALHLKKSVKRELTSR
jgi:hypothetical protein